MEMESLEKSLKTTFVGAANQITQLYTNSLHFQKQAYVHGYNQSTRDTLEFLLKNYSTNSRTIPINELLDYLKNKLEENSSPVGSSHNPKSEVDVEIPESESTRPIGTFYKFDNGLASSSKRAHSTVGNNFSFAHSQIPTSPFSFIPPEDSIHTTPSTPQDLHHIFFTNDSLKKRNFEIPSSSMDYCFPEQSYKKSRVI